MESQSSLLAPAQKRSLREIMPADLVGRLQCKADFYNYLDKHRKSTSSAF